MKKAIFILGLISIVNQGLAQFEINAELRPRGEFRRGYNKLPEPDVTAAFFVSQRTRLNIFYTHDKFKIGIGIQDVRVWGDGQLYSSTGLFGDNASIDLNEGWIELKTGKKGSLKLGRQYLSYEDERLLAKRDWNQSSITYDALLYNLSIKEWDFHLGLSYNNNKENIFGDDYNLYNEVIYFDTATQTILTRKVNVSNRIKSQNFFYLKKRINEKLHVSLVAFATGMQNPLSTGTIYIKGTYGVYGQYSHDIFYLRGSLYHQNGKNASGQRVNAYMFNVKAEVKMDPLFFNTGIDFISGQNAMNDNEDYQDQDHFFDIFYGARHKYYGLMDYFNNMRVATSNGGLIDWYTGLGYKITDKLNLGLDYHYFSLQNKVLDPTITNGQKSALENALGSEFDLVFQLNILPEINLKGGYSIMLPTESMEKIQEIDPGKSKTAYWGWLMLTAKPVLFSSKK